MVRLRNLTSSYWIRFSFQNETQSCFSFLHIPTGGDDNQGPLQEGNSDLLFYCRPFRCLNRHRGNWLLLVLFSAQCEEDFLNSSFHGLPINLWLCNEPCDWLRGWTRMLSFTHVPFPSLTLLKVSPINAVTVRTINQMEVIADGDGDGD